MLKYFDAVKETSAAHGGPTVARPRQRARQAGQRGRRAARRGAAAGRARRRRPPAGHAAPACRDPCAKSVWQSSRNRIFLRGGRRRLRKRQHGGGGPTYIQHS